MSLRRNILANYFSQAYVTLIGIVMVPIYLRYMGAEAYGLVGFFAMLQGWFQLLDMGLTPTMARETARFNGGASDASGLRHLLRGMEGIFVGVAVLGCVALMAASGTIATSWLKVQQLPLVEVQNAIILIAMIVALRWVSGLYRSAITGFERLVWLGGFNMALATARFVLVIPLFIYVGTSVTLFFSYQLLLAVLEVAVLVWQTYRLLPALAAGEHRPWQYAPLRGVLKFSLSIAFASFVWILATQADKLILSKLLPLTEYGYYTLVVLVAGGVLAISGPVSGALLPRLTKLAAAGDDAGLLLLYRNATQLVAVVAVPAALVLALFSRQVLWAWTGDAALVETAAPVLALYAAGSGVSVIAAFPYYLQYAKGELKLHLIGNVLFVLLLIPSLIGATWQFGMLGAAWVWLGLNLAYFLLWIPVVHRRFAPGVHWHWVTKDVLLTSVPALLAALLLQYTASWPVGRPAIAIQLCGLGMLLLGITSLSSSKVRQLLAHRFNPVGIV
ncbi:oligosaccharide flippase family protein [Rhodoferax sp.]|uniref:lipopolysaccharide biosynthesis protein n=1 Tax=Rhodoferax sp. TaxID=50421 RepID=UPI0025FF44A3|nr:oligosaccharide flippase family protein [Rhodoferax sp.]MCM2342361.1 oligosaccharide flippase family protein [Rhodoferax sp.]